GSRGLRAFAVGQLGLAAAGVGTEDVLHVVFGILGAGWGQRRQLLARDDLHDLVAVQNLALQQRLGDPRQGFGVLADNLRGGVITALHQLFHLLVDADSGFFAVVPVLGDLAPQEHLLFLFAEAERTQVAHAPLADHLVGQVGSAFDVVAGAGGHVV